MKWEHARKGIVEGEIVKDLGDFVWIKIKNKVRMGHGDIFRHGFREVYAGKGTTIEVRKSFLTEI